MRHNLIEEVMALGLSRENAEDVIEAADAGRRKIPCEVYSRVVGYIRPVNQWNLGKRSEFEDRKTFKLGGM